MKAIVRTLGGIITASLAFGLFTASATARTLSAGSGRPALGTDNACFNWMEPASQGSVLGLSNNCGPTKNFDTLLPIDNAGTNKSIVVRAWKGQSGTGGAVQCIAGTYDGSGALISNSALTSLNSAAGTWGTISLTLPAVNAGNTVLLRCSLTGSNSSRLLSVDFTQ